MHGSNLNRRVTGAVAVLAIGLSTSCLGGSSKSVIQEVWSPDRLHKAVVYTVHGGATVALNTCVSIVAAPFGELPRKPNVFWAQHGAPDSPEGPYWAPVITVRWVDASLLEIDHDPRARVNQRVSRIDGIRVRYRAVPQQGLPPADTSRGRGS